MTTLPPALPGVVPDVLDTLPPRLRKRVDAALDRVHEWTIEVANESARAALADDTVLTWTLHNGVLTAAGDLACTCLLAPKCLHRALAAAGAPIAEPDHAPQPEESQPVSEVEAILRPEPVQERERVAATALWRACAEILRVGVTASGAVVRGELLRAVHSARVVGLHRAAAAGIRVATGLAEAKAGSSAFDRETLATDLVEVMLLCHDLRRGTGDTDRGTARREYRPIGALRLHGLCTEAIVTTSGHAGVVTHLADSDGTLWTVQAVRPGGLERAILTADGPVALGESGLTHRELGRSGLVVSGATRSPDNRLGAGRQVRAVSATTVTWHEDPLTSLWDQPLPDQLARAHTSPDDLLFLTGTIIGPTRTALRLRLDTGTDVDLTGTTATARDNLRLLAEAPDLSLRVIARLVPDQPTTAVALAVAGDLAVSRHVDLTIDQLQRSHLRGRTPTAILTEHTPEPSPTGLLTTVVHRVVLGGRAVAALPSTARDVRTLSRIGLTATADILDDLAEQARDRERDVFGRVIADETDAFPLAWLTAAVHAREFTRATIRRSWLTP
ncbi:hypothetical protein [Actinokineospora enzanensis]|uniref:hypothetical protein n=1 Tax=Actinokineospora enzanensis TaxID=155975 RepID=UPI00035C69A6|nr:hypothetical protein [Actinokineospora enzanensis]